MRPPRSLHHSRADAQARCHFLPWIFHALRLRSRLAALAARFMGFRVLRCLATMHLRLLSDINEKREMLSERSDEVPEQREGTGGKDSTYVFCLRRRVKKSKPSHSLWTPKSASGASSIIWILIKLLYDRQLGRNAVSTRKLSKVSFRNQTHRVVLLH